LSEEWGRPNPLIGVLDSSPLARLRQRFYPSFESAQVFVGVSVGVSDGVHDGVSDGVSVGVTVAVPVGVGVKIVGLSTSRQCMRPIY